MFMGRFALVLVLLTACSTAAPPKAAVSTPSHVAASPRPLPTPSRSQYLAVVGGPTLSSVSLVASDGAVVATTPVDPAPLRIHTLMSWTSASRTRVYYLNSGSEVRFLAPDGTTGAVTRIALGTTEQAGFSVSPDDSKIAVAIFIYTAFPDANYTGMRLYVEDLNDGGHHVDIFSSTTVAEFPVGWTNGHLILAVTNPRCCQVQPLNPYDAFSYHVVDPATGTRLAGLCNNSSVPEGPIEPIGAVCSAGGFAPIYQRWDGTTFDAPAAVPNPTQYLNAISPDGTRVAVGQPRIGIWGPLGHGEELDQSGYVLGWLDENHLVIQQADSPALSVLEIVDSLVAGRLWQLRAISEISAEGAYLGTFPAAVV